MEAKLLKIPLISISGSLIYRLRGVDPDGDTLKFGIRDQLGSDILRLEAISSNEANIYLVKELDREVKTLTKINQDLLPVF